MMTWARSKPLDPVSRTWVFLYRKWYILTLPSPIYRHSPALLASKPIQLLRDFIVSWNNKDFKMIPIKLQSCATEQGFGQYDIGPSGYNGAEKFVSASVIEALERSKPMYYICACCELV
jgi:hypothetical protein